MKTLKELYTLLLENFDDFECCGICLRIDRLEGRELITHGEWLILSNDFQSRKPLWYSKFYWHKAYIGEMWWWDNEHPEAMEQRKKFIQHIINKL